VGDAPLSLDEKVRLIVSVLRRAGIPHALGGAIALAFAGEPRGTLDIDLNVFVEPEQSGPALEALKELGIPLDAAEVQQRLNRDGQVRLRWNETFVDLFFSNVPFHTASSERIRTVPYGEDEISVLSPEDLVVYKAMFNRLKDWADIEQVLYRQGHVFDLDYARGWLVEMVGESDERVRRLDELVEASKQWNRWAEAE